MRLLNSGFSTRSDELFFDKGTFIVAQLTGNTFYPTTNPTLASIQTQLDALQAALKMPPGQARDGAIATARPPLEESLQDLSENLEQSTPGDLQKLSTTGFDLRKTPAQTSEPPPTPANLRLRNMQERETDKGSELTIDTSGKSAGHLRGKRRNAYAATFSRMKCLTLTRLTLLSAHSRITW
jgi:hypothetical protein